MDADPVVSELASRPEHLLAFNGLENQARDVSQKNSSARSTLQKSVKEFSKQMETIYGRKLTVSDFALANLRRKAQRLVKQADSGTDTVWSEQRPGAGKIRI